VSTDPCAHRVVARLEHVALVTNALERLRDFYEQLGAMASPPWTDPSTGLRSCFLDLCGIRLELLEQPGGRPGAHPDARVSRVVRLGLALGSADAVDEISGVVAAAGHRVVEPPHRTDELGRYESVVLDPDGNVLRLTV